VKIRVLASADEVARAAADFVGELVASRPELVIAFPTGRTPIPFYEELQRRHQARTIDLSRARAFNLDELVLPPGDPRSFRAFMELHGWQRIGFVRERCGIPDGSVADLEAECRRYEEAIVAAGGIDLAILGIGADGHVAYNLPGPSSLATHVVTLPEREAASLGVATEAGPLRAITMGLGTIHAAREIAILATGETKAKAIAALERGVPDVSWPCTHLASHPALTLLLDTSAASATS
jgi:glucosamine-6-phosphate deaminase